MQVSPPQTFDDEIDLFELLDTLLAGWAIWVSTALAGLALAFAASQMIAPQYEATTLIRIGQVGKVGQVESIPVVMERLKSKAFLQEVCPSCDGDALASLSKSLTVSQPKNADVITLVVKASSVAEAKATSDHLLTTLQEQHAELAKPALSEVQRQLAEAEAELKLSQAQRAAVLRNVGKGLASAQSAIAVLQLAEMGSQQEAGALARQVASLRQALTTPSTRPTERMQATYANDKPISPKGALMSVLGLLLGGMFGVAWVLIRKAVQDRKATLTQQA
ncbi:LPS O-antigen subunit length determinant protein (WzzB/FepE family) [Paraperlucidibaca baekdonensis]|uniref:LPS O-antigen subunit length determinant protein (WzzB/FepE family) n=1 Tax=Paraperlucidibaca baekdonensis TaxID=748120 RepID=A0A3E0H647_9GAMM|nr:Wzz/FepE/Etk N-terminal domain-containing protein [Paraperlucidibaca baekdonensis]REH38865.1 LPS O-antigen subunit length determinant protein (WzzB/FepE family) [Paraperlucidibaca baekdonensis]